MGTMATINIRTDLETKKEAEQLFEEFGLTMTSAINVFLKQVIREKRIPFEIGYENPNELTANVLKEAEEGKNLSPVYESIEEMIDSLHA
ncbi:MAG: type II toxin-antitoxin system RelB/DinJ family antitoxin [Treponemataceae bacterium]|nr:type II toxin-antitoxin system RelB/DinJ family antitoxin [Treponemataceae bacterium]